MSEQINTKHIRTMRDLGEGYAEVFGTLDAEFVAMYEGEDGEVDYEALAQGALDGAPVAMGMFVEDGSEYRSGGHTVYPGGFTWFRAGFDDQFWAAVEAAYSVA